MRLYSSVVLCLCASASAQIPLDYVVSLESGDPLQMPANFRVIQPLGASVSNIRDQRVFLPYNSLAVDPDDSRLVLFDNVATSLPGVWEMIVEKTEFAQAMWGPWGSSASRRIACASNDVLFIDGNGLNSIPRAGGAETLVLPLTAASDLAVLGSTVWVSERGAPGSTHIVEFDLATGQSRTVGNFGGITCIGTETAAQLWAGTDSGDLVTIDVASGLETTRSPTGLGPINSIVVTSFGIPVFATANSVWSLLDLQNPLYTTVERILDIDIGRTPGAALFRFDAGCGVVGRTPTWAFDTGVPQTGNTSFALEVTAGPSNAVAALLLGARRIAAPLDLIGLPGCELLTSATVVLPAALDATGSGSIPTALVTPAPVTGLELFGQWFAIDATANALGLATSEGAVLIAR